MSDNKMASGTYDMLNRSMDEIARQIGGMDPDDPDRADRLKELFALSQLSISLKVETR